MTLVSLYKEYITLRGCYRPENSIVTYSVYKYNIGKQKGFLNISIPAKIAYDLGINENCIVDILYEKEKREMIIRLTKDKNGFRVRKKNKNNKPAIAYMIQLGFYKEMGLPPDRYTFPDYKINNGLILVFDDKNKIENLTSLRKDK